MSARVPPIARTAAVVMVAVALCFGLAFIGAGFSDLWPQLLLLLVGASIVGAACFWLGASQRGGRATTASASLGALAVFGAWYGVYAAYAAGWQGLGENDFGSDDLGHGHTYIWRSFLFGLFIVPLAAALLCAGMARLGSVLAGSRDSGGRAPS